MGPNPVNMVAEALLWCCFWPKNLSQAKMSKQGHYRDAKAMNCFSTILDVSFVLLLANGA